MYDDKHTKPKPEKRIRIFLDLDQTVISAEDEKEYDKNNPKDAEKGKKFRYFELKEDGKVIYTIFERPGLQKFLDYLFANFNVSVWTAASQSYALFIIDKIILAGKKNRQLDWIFFSKHCDWSKKLKHGTKDLTMLWDVYKESDYNKDNTIIIDDYDEVYKTQPGNCVIAKPFDFKDSDSDKDTYLQQLKNYLKELKERSNPAEDINKGMGLSHPIK